MPTGSNGLASCNGRHSGGTVATVTVSASGAGGGAPGRALFFSSGSKGATAGCNSRGERGGSTTGSFSSCTGCAATACVPGRAGGAGGFELLTGCLVESGFPAAFAAAFALRRPPLVESNPVEPAPAPGSEPNFGGLSRKRRTSSARCAARNRGALCCARAVATCPCPTRSRVAVNAHARDANRTNRV